MKLTTIFLFAACLHVSAKGLTQTVNLSEKDAPLQKVIKAIEAQTDYVFFYKTSWLQQAKRITIKAENIPLKEALDLCFKGQPLTYVISGKNITIEPKEEKPVEKPTIDISGKITDKEGNPLAGANVKIKGTSKGTTTNEDGSFSLKEVDDNAVLEISYVGFETTVVSLQGRSSLVINLNPKNSSLDEMQVIGYATTTKRLNTGNVSTVKSEDIEKQPINNPLLALQGRIPGMVVNQANGIPGSGVTVQIRGRNSINNGTLPLYIIDGVPYTSENLDNLGGILGASGNNGSRAGNPLSYINAGDIESIDVLKDADATAIYGTRAANGVVLITTKKGKAGKLKLDANFQTGWGKVTNTVEMLNRRQYLDMRYEALKNDGMSSIPSSAGDLKIWDTTRFTDWQKLFIGGTSKYNDAELSLSGGNSNTQYLVSGGYHKETTVFPSDFSNQQGSLHFNLNSSTTDQKLKFQFSSNYTINDNRILTVDLTGLALTLSPVAPALYNDDGTFNWANSTWINPLARYLNRKYKSETNNLVSNATISYTVIPGLELKSSFGYTNMQTDDVVTNSSLAIDPARWATTGTNLRTADFLNSRLSSWTIEPQINYRKNISQGTLSVLIGSTIQQTKSNGQRINTQGFNSDLVLQDPRAASIVNMGATVYSLYKYNAVFGRLAYNWQEKYLINLTGRRDGTSRFGPASQFHNFGAAGIAWIFSKEKLIQNNLHFLSFGKVRGNYGTTGSDQVGDYTFLDTYSPTGAGVPYQGTTGLQIERLYTPDLAWEETKKLEVGLELGFLKDRIIVSGSHYQNTSSNQLTSYALSNVTGFQSINKNVNAEIQNKGWEFSLNTVNINSKDFRWTSVFNIFWNRNKLVSVDSGMTPYYKTFVGRSLSSFYLYKYANVNPQTGLYEFLDVKGNPTATPSASTDRTVLMDLYPRFTGGIQNTIQFKSLQLDFYLYFVKQKGRNHFYNFVPGYWNNTMGNQPVTVLDRWQNDGDVTNIQKFNTNLNAYSAFDNSLNSDRVYSDVSFIRLKNVSLSWQLPKVLREKAHMQNFRLFVHGQNLLTITNYKGLDPETLSTTSLPPLRVITIGCQVVF